MVPSSATVYARAACEGHPDSHSPLSSALRFSACHQLRVRCGITDSLSTAKKLMRAWWAVTREMNYDKKTHTIKSRKSVVAQEYNYVYRKTCLCESECELAKECCKTRAALHGTTSSVNVHACGHYPVELEMFFQKTIIVH